MKTPKFQIHVNRELRDNSGKPMKFYTERDYRSELTKRGLEQFQPEKIKAYQPKRYSGVSDEAKQMMNSVSYDRKGRPNIGDRYMDKLKLMGMKNAPKEVLGKKSGGMYG